LRFRGPCPWGGQGDTCAVSGVGLCVSQFGPSTRETAPVHGSGSSPLFDIDCRHIFKKILNFGFQFSVCGSRVPVVSCLEFETSTAAGVFK